VLDFRPDPFDEAQIAGIGGEILGTVGTGGREAGRHVCLLHEIGGEIAGGKHGESGDETMCS
jgi:hypothetical protein